jgi:peptide/nickel transport system substrate-binding protein
VGGTRRATTSTEPPPTTTTTIPPAAYGGTVVIGDDQEPVTLNPFAEGGDDSIVSIIGQAYLAGVFDIDGTTLEVVPELVKQLPTIGNGGVVLNDDGTMTVRYEIRDEAVWSDGAPITGADIKYTLDLMLDPGISGERWSGLDVVDTAVDGKTFSVTFGSPTLVYETLFPFIVPRHAVEGSNVADDWNDKMWPSAGPFVLSEWRRGEYIRFTRNERYWKVDPATRRQLPYLDEVEFRFIPETEELVYEFTQRAVDVAQPAPFPETLDRLRELEPAGADVQVLPGQVWEHLNFQFGPDDRNPDSMNRYAPFRQAVAYAIDRARIARLIGGIATNSILSGSGGEGPWAQYEPDHDRAAALLAEACEMAERNCATDPPTVVFSAAAAADEPPLIADYLEGALGDIGIEVDVQLEDFQEFQETVNTGTWDMGWWPQVSVPGAAATLATLELFDPDAPAPNGSNYYRWGSSDSTVQNDAVDRFREVLDVAKTSFDPSQVRSLAEAAEQILADDAVVIPVAVHPVVGAVWADKVVGYIMNPTRAGYTWNIEFWYRTDV